jgi:hypothetical protein
MGRAPALVLVCPPSHQLASVCLVESPHWASTHARTPRKPNPSILAASSPGSLRLHETAGHGRSQPIQTHVPSVAKITWRRCGMYQDTAWAVGYYDTQKSRVVPEAAERKDACPRPSRRKGSKRRCGAMGHLANYTYVTM